VWLKLTSSGVKDVASAKVTKSIGEISKQPSSAQSGKIVTFDLQGAVLGENDDGDGGTEGGVPPGRGSENDEKAADQRGQAPAGNATTEWVVLSDTDRIQSKGFEKLKKKQPKSPACKNRSPTKGGHDDTVSHARHLQHLSSLQDCAL